MREKTCVKGPLKRIKQMVGKGKSKNLKVLSLSEKEEAYFREITGIEEESKKSDYSVGGPVIL